MIIVHIQTQEQEFISAQLKNTPAELFKVPDKESAYFDYITKSTCQVNIDPIIKVLNFLRIKRAVMVQCKANCTYKRVLKHMIPY
jgi:hypothetical protein